MVRGKANNGQNSSYYYQPLDQKPVENTHNSQISNETPAIAINEWDQLPDETVGKILIQDIKSSNHVCETYSNIIISCSRFQIREEKKGKILLLVKVLWKFSETRYLKLKTNSKLHSIPVPSNVMKQVRVDLCGLPELDGYRNFIAQIFQWVIRGKANNGQNNSYYCPVFVRNDVQTWLSCNLDQ